MVEKITVRKRIVLTLGSILLIVAGGSLSVFLLSLLFPTKSPNYTETKLDTGTPDYSTLAPTNKSLTDLGGWTLISPPGKDKVYAYIDYINNVRINVSQQPLPSDLKDDTSKQIEELAKSFNATTLLKIDDTAVYIGTSADGPQSVIFTKKDLLILIKSTAKIDNDKWVEYIKLLN